MTTPNTGQALLPCPNPWCEESKPVIDKLYTDEWCGRCKSCDIFTPVVATEAEAITAWNTRTLPPDRNGVLEEAVEPLLRFHETGGHEGDGSDERITAIRKALKSTEQQQEGSATPDADGLVGEDSDETLQEVLADVATLLRGYEEHHRKRAHDATTVNAAVDSSMKAERNCAMAWRVERQLEALRRPLDNAVVEALREARDALERGQNTLHFIGLTDGLDPSARRTEEVVKSTLERIDTALASHTRENQDD